MNRAIYEREAKAARTSTSLWVIVNLDPGISPDEQAIQTLVGNTLNACNGVIDMQSWARFKTNDAGIGFPRWSVHFAVTGPGFDLVKASTTFPNIPVGYADGFIHIEYSREMARHYGVCERCLRPTPCVCNKKRGAGSSSFGPRETAEAKRAKTATNREAFRARARR